MISGRLRWRPAGAKIPARLGSAAFDFGDTDTLLLTEASKKKRASLHYVEGSDTLADFDRGGISPIACTDAEFAKRIIRENRTLKRALTDPRIFAGIGNAYSDEILHHAQLAPTQRTRNLSDEEITRVQQSIRKVVTEWTDRLRNEVGDGFPEKVTAFRDEMAVHGKYGKPCPVCDTKVQRIKYASNEANYCPRCQTGGKLLADRALSRLLKGDWPKSIEELENQGR
jgi:formamidopyrimidine-DNA glycosylase